MKRILVTGGLGFLGSHLVDALVAQGHSVTIVDSCISNVMQPADYEHCEVIVQPIEHCGDRLSAENHPRFDEIYHLACVVGPAGVLLHAGDIAPTTIDGSETTVQLALSHSARLIVVSTSEIYGRGGRFAETDHAVVSSKYTIRLEYAVAELLTELSALNRARVTDLWVNVVRPFNIAGPRQLAAGGFVLPRFVIAALRGEPLTVFGTGKQVRAFTDPRDMVDGLLAVMASDQKSQVFNLGNPVNEISMEDLATRVKRLAQSSAEIVYLDGKEVFGPLFEDGIEKVPDAAKALDLLGWKPRFDLDATILDTLQWYRERPERLVSLQWKKPAATPA